MIARQMGEYIQDQIYQNITNIFQKLGLTISKEDIWHDLAQVTGSKLTSTFYVKGVDNVKRKAFNELVALEKNQNPILQEFKVKYKRPEKEVRFYIHLEHPQNESN